MFLCFFCLGIFCYICILYLLFVLFLVFPMLDFLFIFLSLFLMFLGSVCSFISCVTGLISFCLLLWLPSCFLSSPLTSVLLFSSSLCSSPLIVRLVLICVTLTCPSLFIEVHVFPLVFASLSCYTMCRCTSIIFCFLWCFLCLMMNFWLILVFTPACCLSVSYLPFTVN